MLRIFLSLLRLGQIFKIRLCIEGDNPLLLFLVDDGLWLEVLDIY